jgi:RNA polymerase sigma factor (sigma-70 family)
MKLSKEEELEAIKNNNRDKLVRKYKLLVMKIAKKYAAILGLQHMEDDLVQEGYIGLLYAIDRFDISKINVDISKNLLYSYARICIDYYIKNFLYKRIRTVRVPKSIIYKKDENNESLVNTYMFNTVDLDMFDSGKFNDSLVKNPPSLTTESNHESSLFLKEVSNKLSSVLNDREKRMMVMRIVHGCSFVDMAKEFGVTKQRAHQMWEVMYDKINRKMWRYKE